MSWRLWWPNLTECPRNRGNFISRKEEGNKSLYFLTDLGIQLVGKSDHTQFSDEDILGLLISWWPTDMIPEVKVVFNEVDKQLSLSPGSTKKHIDKVAEMKLYKRLSFGNVVAVYELDGAKLFGRVVY